MVCVEMGIYEYCREFWECDGQVEIEYVVVHAEKLCMLIKEMTRDEMR